MAKHTLTKSGVALLCAVAGGAQAAEVTANIGYMSEYIFRGISQSDSAAMGGIDLKANGFYLGNWNADVGEGLEVDIESDSGETSLVFRISKTFGLLK